MLMRMLNFFRGKRLALVVVTLAVMLAASVALALDFPFNTTTNDKVNMRKSASSTSSILAKLEKDEPLTVVGEKGNYYKVEARDKTGYVMKQFIVTDKGSITTPTPVPVETVYGYPYDTVTTDKVNLRAKKSVYSSILTKIPEGATITVTGVSGTFASVTYKQYKGYVKTDFIILKKVVKPTKAPTPVPTLSPEEDVAGYIDLRKGDSGPAVKALQNALIELGFLSGKPDGQFGSATEYAVLSFQQANNYPTTGIVDAIQQAHLYSGKPKNHKGVKTDVMTLAPLDYVTINLNNKGDLVVTVQQRLKELGYYKGELSGVYDKTTRSAVKSFQKKNGLKDDGICGAATQKLLLEGDPLSASATKTPKPTKTPTPAPTFNVPDSTVRRGSKGDAARAVQQRLKDLGYYKGKVDGNFGSGSEDALEAFQKNNGLEADGVAGQGTYTVLFSHDAVKAGATATPAPTKTPKPTATPTPEPITEDNVVTVKLGVEGDIVRRIQERLTELGYYSATVDGVCKKDDVAAIKAFQKANGLRADGVAGYDTQSRLFSADALSATGMSDSSAVDTSTTLRKGMSGEAVLQLQKRLIQLGYLTGEADGKYGRATADAVYNFQKRNGLGRDGVAGPATLALLYSAAAATPTPAPTKAPDTNLQRGDASDAVRDLQQRLIDLGYLTGKADGKFGVSTYRALVAFQRANGLKADGIAGLKTLNLLNSTSALSANTPSITPAPSSNSSSKTPKASSVRYGMWYTEVRARAKLYPYATIYDFATGISWQVHMFSLGAHADAEPLTSADTAKMERAFGGNTWNPKPVWVVFGDGRVYMASTHSMPHAPQHRTDNGFDGHFCIHFPRTASQVASIGPYATSHQKSIDAGWKKTQDMIK